MRQEGEARPVGVTGRACWSAGLIIPETGHDRGVTEGFGGRGASWPMPPLCPLDNMTQRSRPGRLEAGCDSQACGRGGLPRSSPVEPQSPPGLQTEQEVLTLESKSLPAGQKTGIPASLPRKATQKQKRRWFSWTEAPVNVDPE